MAALVTENENAYGDHLALAVESPMRMFGTVVDGARIDNGGSPLAATSKPLFTQGLNHVVGHIQIAGTAHAAGLLVLKFLQGPTPALCTAPVLHFTNANPAVGSQLLLHIPVAGSAAEDIGFHLPVNYPYMHLEEAQLDATAGGDATTLATFTMWGSNLGAR